MTTMAYIIAGVCVLLAVAGMAWYALMVRGGSGDPKTDGVSAETSGEGAAGGDLLTKEVSKKKED